MILIKKWENLTNAFKNFALLLPTNENNKLEHLHFENERKSLDYMLIP